MNLITEKYFEKFLVDLGIEGGKKEKNFEKFINYTVLFPKNISKFNLASATTGDGGDCAIDGLAIVISNKFISNIAELEDILETGMNLTLELYFIQTKMSENFDGKEILQFGNGIVDLFKSGDETTKVRNGKIIEKCKMINLILENYDSFSSPPKCYMYFVTTGIWVDDTNLIVDKNKVISDIKQLDLFEAIEFYPYGSKEIRKQYELTRLQNSADFELKDKIELPYMPNIQKSYIATLPVKEYLKIIMDEHGKITKGIFELNVRDFKGIEDNRVNQDIINTINSSEKQYFGLLNNGITIVGRSLNSGIINGKKTYTIKNFYVVNGCQTSNVLHLNSENIDEDMWIAIKIVITDNDEIINNIVKATNNQTEVEEIQMLSTTEYQGLLESFFNSFDTYYSLYYERREGQYNYINHVETSRIINPDVQIRSFASVFLGSPHRASRSYGSLLDDIGKDNDTNLTKGIFVSRQEPIIYYTSALLLNILENSFNNDKIDNKYSKFKYHILFIISKIVWKDNKRPQLNSKNIENYCIILIEKILNEENFDMLLRKSIEIINAVINNLDDQESNKSAHIVNLLTMYIELGTTYSSIKARISFLNQIDDIIAPFYNIRIDGDLRYNFYDRLYDLKSRIKAYGMNNMFNFLEDIRQKVNVDSRISRKQYANEIYLQVEKVCEEFKVKIELSKQYTKLI